MLLLLLSHASVMSDSAQPHRRQPTRLPRPSDSPGKNTGVGCHFLLQCVKVKSEREVAQSYPTLSDPMDCSLPGFSVHGIFQAGVLEWVPLPSLNFWHTVHQFSTPIICSFSLISNSTLFYWHLFYIFYADSNLVYFF